jgi:LysR family hydrogen peroxide-inducible transcriptional activator
VPTLTQLEYALAVERHRHFGRAAEACRVSQPTLSQQLAKLEDELEFPVFDRRQKPVLPTERGQAFLTQAAAVVREHQRLMELARAARGGAPTGEFRLAVIPTVANSLMPLFVTGFARANSGVTLRIEELKTESILEELRRDRIDGALMATPLPEDGFHVRPLYYEPFLLYASPGHELLRRERLSAADLDAAELWMLQDGHCFGDQVATLCALPPAREGGPARTAGALANVEFRSGSLDTLRHVVRRNGGVTLIPALMAELLDPEERKRCVRSFRRPVPTREVSLVHRREHWKLDLIRAIEAAVGRAVPAALRKPAPAGQATLLKVC